MRPFFDLTHRSFSPILLFAQEEMLVVFLLTVLSPKARLLSVLGSKSGGPLIRGVSEVPATQIAFWKRWEDKIIAERKGLGKVVKGCMGHLFPQRQILVRAKGQVRYFTLSRSLQVALAGLSLGIAGWVVHSSLAYFAYESILAAKDAQIDHIRAAYTDIISDKDALLEQSDEAYQGLRTRTTKQRTNLLDLAGRLEESQQRIQDILAQRSALETNLSERKVEIARWGQAYAQAVDARDALARDLRQMENELNEMAHQNVTLHGQLNLIQGHLDDVKARKVKTIAQSETLSKRLAKANAEITRLREAGALLSQRNSELKGDLTRAVTEHDQLMAKRSFLQQRVEGLEKRHDDLNEIQQNLIERLMDLIGSNSVEVEKALAHTGIDVDDLLAELSETPAEDDEVTGKGGPFVAYMPRQEEHRPDFAQVSEIEVMSAALDGHAERWEGLRQLLRRLPLSPPLDQFRITSGFGRRRDPINGKIGMHYALDLSSRPGTSVLATAPGTVTFVGRKGRYGKTVEIDHGIGVRTRYGHLRKILVKKGQEVRFREKIGIIGSTGRSTGLHVHYEVLVHGKPCDPLKFIRAGRYVFRG